MRSSGIDTRALRSLLSFLRRGLYTDGDADELFARLRKLFGSEGIALGQDLDFRGWSSVNGVPARWKADHIRLRHLDPSLALLQSPAGSCFVPKRDATEEQLRNELVDAFHAAGFFDAAVCKIYSPFRDDLILALYRCERRFTEEETLLLDLIYPHLAAGLAARRAFDVLSGGAAFDAPAVFVSFPAATVEADARARAAIERRTGPVSGTGWSRVQKAIAVAARRFCLAQAVGRSQILWPGLRIDFAVVTPERGASMRLVGFLIDEDERREERSPALVEAMLSPRQLAVARHFAQGMDVPTIAETLRIGPETVRSHLRLAYRKLGVTNRVELNRALEERAPV